MKVAGRKNDGAWFRVNKKISALGSAGKSALSEQLKANTGVIAMYTAVQDLLTAAGYAEAPTNISSVDDWCNSFVNVGIPRQVWLGVLTWDTYTKAGSPAKYTPDHQEIWRIGAIQIRKTVSRFFLARRQVLDFAQEVGADEGNPGGIADADIAT